MTKALIVYGTRFGATASTSEEIAEILRSERIDVKVVNSKKDKVQDITEYELVIVGSGIQINKWTGEPEKFLKKFQKELAKKKVALFVCCGSTCPIAGDEATPEDIASAKRKYLEEKAAKYNLQPVAMGLFGGIYDFNNKPWWAGGFMNADLMQKLEAAGIKEAQPGVYDTRDLNAIRSWAKEVAQTVHS
jgi:menaquinone-dependent protoporphyrinogen IX oxidase